MNMRSIGITIAAMAMAAGVGVWAGTATQPSGKAPGERVELKITGGHETDPRDRGRPVVLVAAGLGVPEDVFREAFSHVKPAPAGERPTEERARENKAALMKALAKYGVTNERLDEVSNYYRYRREREELWKHKAADGYATIENGKVTGIVITEPGAGYSSTPTITVSGHDDVRVKVTVAYEKELAKNGHIASAAIEAPTTQP